MTISVDEALKRVLSCTKLFGTQEVELLKSCGRILAESIVADRDFPPFDRVTMDGIAINIESFSNGKKNWIIESIQAAGVTVTDLSNQNNCIEVMTGAVMPINTNAVIPYEHLTIENGCATIATQEVLLMQNVHRKGADCKAGDTLVRQGEIINASTIGIMASVGLSTIKVYAFPSVVVCSTGDELVAVDTQPQDHQVRISNSYTIAAALLKEGIEADILHIPDDPVELKKTINLLLKKDVIIFSGAVSKGKYDYLPGILNKLGMETIFHTVAQRPGKPFLFGKFNDGPVVFAFPGNPVSTFVCYQIFFRQWLYEMIQKKQQKVFALLSEDVNFKPALSYHLLVKVYNEKGILYATPLPIGTSGDLVTLADADGIITLPAGTQLFHKGEVFEVTLF